MVIAYVLIIARAEDEHSVYNELVKSDVVEELFPLFGEWDLIAKVTAETNEELADKITNEIRPIEGILSTKTLLGY